MTLKQPLLSARLSVDYGKKRVLDELEIDIEPGEIVGLIGASGSGKSTLSLAVLRLLDPKRARVTGEVWFEGRNLVTLREAEMRSLRGRRIALLLQSPATALNAFVSIGSHLKEAWRAHRPDCRHGWKSETLDLFRRLSLPTDEGFLKRYPRELSVGQAQRVLIAMAALHRPALLIADEPTSALDVISQAQTLELFAQIRAEFGVAILMISHDLLSVANLCSRVAILNHGRIVESGGMRQIFQEPVHPYTRQLIAALPKYPAFGEARTAEPELALT